MPVSNKPSVTTFQVGQTVYFNYMGKPMKDEVVSTTSIVTDIDNNNTGEQSDSYFLKNTSGVFKGSQLFSSKAALEAALDAIIDDL